MPTCKNEWIDPKTYRTSSDCKKFKGFSRLLIIRNQ